MSVSSAKAYLDRIFKDEKFRAEVEAAMGDEAKLAVVKKAGFDFTQADLESLLPEGTSLSKLRNIKAGDELPDEVLEAVAGGKGETWTDQDIVNTTIAGVGAVAGIVGAAAAAA
jgi:predicted ribosomally synthesized peptide with nif11-like leader